MGDFVRMFLMLRDGNKTPTDSYQEKTPKIRKLPAPAFELSFIQGMESVDSALFKEMLLEAARSGYTYARFHVRYHSHRRTFVACNELLDNFLLPLKFEGIIGNAVPLISTDCAGQWLIELFPIEVIPRECTVEFGPKKLLSTLLTSGVEFSDPPPEPTEH